MKTKIYLLRAGPWGLLSLRQLEIRAGTSALNMPSNDFVQGLTTENRQRNNGRYGGDDSA